MCATIARNEPCSTEFRVLVVFGSPRRNGSTAQLLDSFLQALPPTALVDRFDCFTLAPHPCTDCRVCHKNDRCAFTDLDDFYAKLESASVLVFATPVYNLSFPAPMKALIDRTQRYWVARFIRGMRPPIPKHKQAVLLTSCGADGLDAGQMIERQLKPVLTVLNAKLTEIVHYNGSDKGNPMEPFLVEAAMAAHRLSK